MLTVYSNMTYTNGVYHQIQPNVQIYILMHVDMGVKRV